jgi:PhnB protein
VPIRGTDDRHGREDEMASKLNPYLQFNGNAREAMEFYREVFGGELRTNTFGEYGTEDPAMKDQTMHAQLESDLGFTLMAADSMPDQPATLGGNISISLSGEDADVLRGYWEKLGDGGNVTMPLEKQVWGDEFGMLVDPFGIQWMVNVSQPAA